MTSTLKRSHGSTSSWTRVTRQHPWQQESRRRRRHTPAGGAVPWGGSWLVGLHTTLLPMRRSEACTAQRGRRTSQGHTGESFLVSYIGLYDEARCTIGSAAWPRKVPSSCLPACLAQKEKRTPGMCSGWESTRRTASRRQRMSMPAPNASMMVW